VMEEKLRELKKAHREKNTKEERRLQKDLDSLRRLKKEADHRLAEPEETILKTRLTGKRSLRRGFGRAAALGMTEEAYFKMERLHDEEARATRESAEHARRKERSNRKGKRKKRKRRRRLNQA